MENHLNKYDELYNIRLATPSDTSLIMSFIGKCWRKDHLFANNKELFNFYFYDHDYDKVNFLLAIRKISGKLDAIIGFVCSSSIRKRADIWVAFWGADNNPAIPLIGVELFRRLQETSGCRNLLTIGDSQQTSVPILGLVTDRIQIRLKRFYMLNKTMDNYRIVINPLTKRETIGIYSTKNKLVRFNSFEMLSSRFDVELDDAVPFKDKWYVKHRYFDYPWIKYDVFGIESPSAYIKAIVVFKEVFAVDSKALQIIDYIGDQRALLDAGASLVDYLIGNKYEYMDFYEYGFDERILINLGFVEQRKNDLVIIPDYFEPFQRKSDDIWASFEKTIKPSFFKGDGDLDRPRIL